MLGEHQQQCESPPILYLLLKEYSFLWYTSSLIGVLFNTGGSLGGQSAENHCGDMEDENV